MLPAALLSHLRAAYAADAAAIDAAHFAPDRPLSAALDAAAGMAAGDDPLDLAATFADTFDAGTRADLLAAAGALGAMPQGWLDQWRTAFAGRRRAASGTAQPEPDRAERAVNRHLDTLVALIGGAP